MISRDSVTQAVTEIIGPELLAKAAKVDIRPNSLQIKGNPEVQTIAIGVSCSMEFLKKAIEAGASYVICHHGLSTADTVVAGRFDAIEDRLKFIIKNDLSLAGFHYSLDVHPEIGNNAQLIKKIFATQLAEMYGEEWGYVAEFKTPIMIDDLIARAKKITQENIFVVKAGPKKIKRIGVCSGGVRPNKNELMEIIDKHIDAHITGEIGEADVHNAEALGFNYLACGHYATETFGIKALGQKLVDKFGIGVQVKFIDVPSTL